MSSSNNGGGFYSTEVGKRYLDFSLKNQALAYESHVQGLDRTKIYAWFNQRTRQLVSKPWARNTFLDQDTINNVRLYELTSFQDVLFGFETPVFWFPPVTIHPANLNFPFVFFIEAATQDAALTGDTINEFIIGADGDNTIHAGAGNDVLIGKAGFDGLTGGGGSDRFLLTKSDVDTITDFNPNQDLIFFENVEPNDFVGFAPNAFINADQFTIGASATTESHRFIYDTTSGTLFFDADGTGAAAQQALVNLSPGLTLSHQNLFFLQNADYLITLSGPGAEPEKNPLNLGVIRGSADNDTLTGGPAHEQLLGLDGNDILIAGDGNDDLNGGKGNDKHYGGNGRDRIWSGTGNDVVLTGAGNDVVALERGAGKVVVKDFRDRQDKLGLTPGLKFSQLDIVSRGKNTLIQVGNDPLALLTGVKAHQITASDIIRISLS